MRIAQVAPLYESVSPKLYGGTDHVVSYLTEELVRLGHEVTLFASGDSVTKARLASVCKKALRLTRTCASFVDLVITRRAKGFTVDVLRKQGAVEAQTRV